jgi:hypothetical protein
VELSRIHGESNRRTFSDGFRVPRTIGAEYRRARRSRRESSVIQLEDARTYLHPRNDLIEDLVPLVAVAQREEQPA